MFSKHSSAEVITICMLLLEQDVPANNLWVMGSTPIQANWSDSSVARATDNVAGSNPAPDLDWDSSDGRALHQGCSVRKKSTTS